MMLMVMMMLKVILIKDSDPVMLIVTDHFLFL